MQVLILDFGSQYSHLILRRVREFGLEAELVPVQSFRIDLLNSVQAIILSGGPRSVYDLDAIMPPLTIFKKNIPILGICYGHQLIVHMLGGKVESSPHREYGIAEIQLDKEHPLFFGLQRTQQVWMSHGDFVRELPAGFEAIAFSTNDPYSAIANDERQIYSVQFHPEVAHTINGRIMLRNFLTLAGFSPKETQTPILDKIVVPEIEGNILLGLSGGVDSSVTAAVLHRKYPNDLYCVFIDTGLLRNDDYEHVSLVAKTIGLKHFIKVDASKSFLTALKGITDPEVKRKTIGRIFIKVFEDEARRLAQEYGQFKHLAQGTIYPDRIESAKASQNAATIKSHHNVGGLPEKMNLSLIEPLADLYKDEVRMLGLELGLPHEVLFRHPFPGPGLAVRIVGEVTPSRVEKLRKADSILIDELRKAKVYYDIWQAYAALLPTKTVGVMGDQRTYEEMILVRLVESTDGMTADIYNLKKELAIKISSRIVNEIDGVNRVVYDITQKPPATIELE